MASPPAPPLSCTDYTVACVCPMGIELAPVLAMLDQNHPLLPTERDQNSYSLGSIGDHNVVVAVMPEIGNNAAATVATQLVNDFPSIRFALLVGIGGGIPGGEEDIDIRLGDVVVSQPTGIFGGVVQYDLGKALSNPRFERVGQLDKPPAVLSATVRKLQAQHLMTGSRIPHYFSDMLQRYPLMSKEYSFPTAILDQFFPSSYRHISGKTCNGCDPSQAVQRPARYDSEPHVHYGTIGSANTVVKDASLRDKLQQDMGVLCVEMEAAGLMNAFPCLVIRGICDYADSHKNKEWQPYAAAVDAAYMKELLSNIPYKQVLQQQHANEAMVTDLLRANNKLHRKSLGIQQEQSSRRSLEKQSKRERKCHQSFKTSSYEQFKNNNPDRVQGTCRWVLEHDQYHEWQKNHCNDLLWISADPGCGKSVLAKSLVDHEFSDRDHYNTCYFFFKDNGVQDNTVTALCAVLHQLFSQQPILLRYALSARDEDGDRIRQELDGMWRVLLAATADPLAKPTVCILDALDECQDRDRSDLITKICHFYQLSCRASSNAPLKFLLTSRPYDNVRRWFMQTPPQMRQIWLRGECENDQINQEINLVIGKRVRDLTDEFSLPRQEENALIHCLHQMQHRTYLWLYLSIEEIRANYRDCLFTGGKHFDSLPQSVEDAYERILSKVDKKQEDMARRILLIILGARRPLRVDEMASALGVACIRKPNGPKVRWVNIERLEAQIRSLCGLFVFVNHSQLFLIHQTAKEFLLTQFSGASLSTWRWKSSFRPEAVEKEMAELCITALTQKDSIANWKEGEDWDLQENFYAYCAEHWSSHLTNEMLAEDRRLLQKAAALYEEVENHNYHSWFSIALMRHRFYNSYEDAYTTRLQHVVAMGGLTIVFKTLHRKHGFNLNLRDGTGMTVLHCALRYEHKDLADWLLRSDIKTNIVSREHGTPLHLAALCGYEEMVQTLLQLGAKVNARRGADCTALALASSIGEEKVVRLLLDHGAWVNVGNSYSNPLCGASENGHTKVVQALLERGADVNHPGSEPKPLHLAVLKCHTDVVRILLERGAKTNTIGDDAKEAASECGDDQLRKMLVDRGVQLPQQNKNWLNMI